MSLVDNGNGMYMPVAPAYAGGNGGFGGFGCGDGWWVILFLFALMGNNGFGGWGGNGDVLPYLWNQNTNDSVNSRFDALGLSNQVSGVQNSINSGFANAEIAACGRAMDAMQTAYQNEINSLQRSFAAQTQMADCCCKTQSSIAQLSADLAREACADRQAVADGVQKILTQMCDDKIDAKNEKILELQNQLAAAQNREFIGANTSRILADNASQTVALEQYLNPTAIPAYVVQNPNCCQQNVGCGCGNNGFYN